jgi:alanyl-tRNA synthetase
LEAEIRIARYRKVTQQKKTFYQLVFDQTPFYGESGGQVGDSGTIESDGKKINVFDTQKENNLIVHLVEKLPDDPTDFFRAKVNGERRMNIANNHTATHLLHAALRQVLGTHVEQKGSLVNADHLRFDFSHFQKMTDEEIEKVEGIVNAKIRENAVLEENRSMPIEEAKQSGAMMLFGEKYGESVRVIKFGESVELCGGTHVQATGNIGLLKIVSESAIAAGVRRIEAITAARAEKYVNDQIKTLNSVRETIKGSKDILGSVAALLQQNAELSKQLENFQRESLKIIKANLKSKVLFEKGVNIISGTVEIDDAALLKDLAFQLKGEVKDLYLVLGAEIGGKPSLTIMISDNIVAEKGLDASKIVREAGREIQGGGGGQPFYATAGGKNAAGLQAAIEKALSVLQ